jgi:hypothetical protein
VEVEYHDLPRVTSPRVAVLPGAPSVWDEARDNVLVDTMFGDSEAIIWRSRKTAGSCSGRAANGNEMIAIGGRRVKLIHSSRSPARHYSEAFRSRAAKGGSGSTAPTIAIILL